MLRTYAMAAMIAAGTLGVVFAAPAQVNAMPLATIHSDGMPLVKVRDGCGRGWHLNRWGHCVFNRRHHHRHYGSYQSNRHGWHRPHHRHWRHHDRRHNWRQAYERRHWGN